MGGDIGGGRCKKIATNKGLYNWKYNAFFLACNLMNNG